MLNNLGVRKSQTVTFLAADGMTRLQFLAQAVSLPLLHSVQFDSGTLHNVSWWSSLLENRRQITELTIDIHLMQSSIMSETLYVCSLFNFMVLYLVTGYPYLLCYIFNSVVKGNIMTQCAYVCMCTHMFMVQLGAIYFCSSFYIANTDVK